MIVERGSRQGFGPLVARAARAGLAVTWLSLSVMPAEGAYTLVDLGGLPEGGGAVAVSSDGGVAGYEMHGPFMPHATLFSHGQQIDLGTLGGDASYANGIGAGGRVVGWARLPDATRHAFLYEGGVMHDLGTLGGTTSNAFAISDAGIVVGSSLTADGELEVPMIWTADAGMRALLPPEVVAGQALGINRRGQIVGHFYDGSLIHAFVYERGSARTLPSLGGIAAKAYGISSSGIVAGYSLTSDPTFPKFHAVLWDRDGIHDLGALAGGHGTAYDVNDDGMAVGFSYDANLNMVATCYVAGVLHDLNEELPAGSPWHLSMASGITEAGVISGTGQLNGVTRAFALVPDGAPGDSWGLASAARLRAWPQPMRETGTVELTLAGSTTARVSLYDVAGRRVADLGTGSYGRGTVSIAVPASVLSRLDSGVYFARAEGPGVAASARLVVVQ